MEYNNPIRQIQFSNNKKNTYPINQVQPIFRAQFTNRMLDSKLWNQNDKIIQINCSIVLHEEMKFPSGQLKQSLKILTYQFVISVQKMYSLHHEQMHANKQQMYSRVLQTLQMERKSMFSDDCVKILENSYDDKLKSDCFEKEFSVISVQNHSAMLRQSQSFSQSDCFDHHHQQVREQFEDSDDRLKKGLLQRQQQANQTTKYNYYSQQGFFVNENIIADSTGVKCQQQDEQQNQQRNSIYQQQQVSSKEPHYESQSSSQTPNSQSQDSEYVMNSLRNEGYEKQVQTKSSMKRTLFTMRKKYRSYTQQQRQEAVHLANTKGIEFAAQYLSIPKKNITRWMKRTEKKQRVRGRKPGNPNMEENLNDWIVCNIQKGRYLTQSEIRNKAKMFSGNNSFKASKGWLEKYFRRNKFISEGLNGLLSGQRRGSITSSRYKREAHGVKIEE